MSASIERLSFVFVPNAIVVNAISIVHGDHEHNVADMMRQNLENDKRISLTYSQTLLCCSRAKRTKVVCSSLMQTQTFTRSRRLDVIVVLVSLLVIVCGV